MVYICKFRKSAERKKKVIRAETSVIPFVFISPWYSVHLSCTLLLKVILVLLFGLFVLWSSSTVI